MKRLVLFSGLFLMLAVGSLSAQETDAAWTKNIPLKAEDTLFIYVDPGSLQIVPWEKKEIGITVQGGTPADRQKIQVSSKNKDVRLDFVEIRLRSSLLLFKSLLHSTLIPIAVGILKRKRRLTVNSK